MAANDLAGLWRRLREHGDALSEHEGRIEDLEQSMSDLVEELKQPLADYEYERRKREDRRRTLGDWRIWVAAAGGLIIAIQSAAALYLELHH